MLSLDLFDSRYEKRLHEGAVDDAEYARLDDLRKKIKVLDLAREKTKDPEMHRAIDDRKKVYADEIKDILSVRGMKEAEQPAQPQTQKTKGIGDIQDPKQKMAQLAQRSKKGPLANVAAGIKAFVKGEPEPMGEEQQAINPRALGVANFQRIAKANAGFQPTVYLEFIRPEENFKLDQRGIDLISDYYDGLENDQAKNYFIYRVLPSGEETLKVLKQLGYSPVQAQQQQNLPGIPTQGELPLQEKKKSNNDDLEAGDIKVARELQKLRAEYPAARSDVEAVARAEIDSTERSQRQLAAIRGANEKQDALLKQLVALDQEQGREISGLDKENNSLEQRLAQVQATNDRLQQTIGQMTGTKKAPARKPTDAEKGGIIDLAPIAAPAQVPSGQPEPAPKQQKATAGKSPAIASMAQQIQALNKPAPGIRPAPGIKSANEPQAQAVAEHGGGIGPRQHWQDLMQEGQPQELINRYLAIDAETDVEAVRKAIQAISRDSTLSATSKSRLLGQIGMIIRRHRLPIGRSYYTFMQQYMEEQTVSETVENVRAGMAKIYRRLAPKIERHRDSFLAGQLYDELENYAELHGAEGDFKRMMSTARGRAHMEYDTNPGGFQNWFWFLPFEDNQLEEGFTDTLKSLWRELKTYVVDFVANAVGLPDDQRREVFVQAGNTFSNEVIKLLANHPARDKLIPMVREIGGYMAKARTLKELNSLMDKAELFLADVDAGKFDPPSRVAKTLPRFDDRQDMKENTDDIKKRMSKLEALALAANRAGDDAKCKRYQEKIQALKQKLSQSMAEGWSDQGNPTAYSVYIDGREWRAYKSDEQARRVAEKVQANLKLQGRDQTVTIAPSRTKKVNEAKEIVTKNDFLDRRDYLLRKIDADSNPANKQIIRAEIRKLESQAEAEGWITMQQRMVREDSDSGEAVEMAIMRRMLVAHTDLIVEFGLDRVVDAIEEVAYNVGDTDEIGSSDVSGWVNQVRQILGADA